MNFRSVKVAARIPLLLVGVAVVLAEEFLWAWLGWAMAQLSRWAPVSRFEAAIARLPPFFALILFLLPWGIVLPVKFMAFYLIAVGEVMRGVMLFVIGEVLSMAVLARLYALCRPALRQWPWFCVGEELVVRWTQWAHNHLEQIAFYRQVTQTAHAFFARVRAFLGLHSGFFRWPTRVARRCGKTPV
jgi:hypothetical protein